MNPEIVREILERVRKGDLSVESAMERLGTLPFVDIGFAHIDTHRALRCGFHEVVFCSGKTPEQVVRIAEKIIESDGEVLATRATPEVYRALKERWDNAEYHELARAVTVNLKPKRSPRGFILVVTAGTSDIPVAEEARLTAEIMNNYVETLYDVGVAGIHRLFHHTEQIRKANVIVAVAGMEGALPSVLGGMCSRPVIAVPTSTGYGVSFGGISALLTMLNSCSAGVAVVNIDNGFGAGFVASLINQTNMEVRTECQEEKR